MPKFHLAANLAAIGSQRGALDFDGEEVALARKDVQPIQLLAGQLEHDALAFPPPFKVLRLGERVPYFSKCELAALDHEEKQREAERGTAE